MEKKKLNPNHHFDLHFRTKKHSDRESIVISCAYTKLAHFLCSRFDVVILPKFEPSKKTKKEAGGNCKIGKRTSRDIYSWSFYRFEQLMARKGLETNTEVILCDKPYTTMTCGHCGELNRTLGSRKIFHCARCGLICDRDVNGARNIPLRYLTLLIQSYYDLDHTAPSTTTTPTTSTI